MRHICAAAVVALVSLNADVSAKGSISDQTTTSKPTPAATPSAMTNQEVVTLVAAGLPEDIVVAKIRQTSAHAFDLSADGLVALKGKGVSDGIIRVMLDPAAPAPANAARPSPAPSGTPPAAPVSSLPSEIGVYLRNAGKLSDVEPEVVNWKTGGILKTMVTGGLKGPHMNGYVRNPTSRLELPKGAEIIVMTPEGTVVTEYQLLRLDKKKDRREFRAMSMGMLGAKSGTQHNGVSFDHEKLASRIYVIRLGSLQPGEYGVLPPGLTSASLGSAGKIYAFTVK